MHYGFFLGLLSWFLLLPLSSAQANPSIFEDDKSAAIFVYNRVGEDGHPETNIRTAQFEEHIQELRDGDYTVLSLPDLTEAFQANRTLPKRSVVITFDGGHRSILKNALPLLQKHDLPYTIFFASDYADLKSEQYLSWDDLRKVQKNPLATIGIHPAAYTRLYMRPDKDIRTSLNTAVSKYREELGQTPGLFAYPFGESSAQYRKIVKSYNFTAALGQQSGIAYAGSDFLSLPRFPMTESYGDLQRFQMIANALPLPLKDIEPQDPYITSNPPAIGFTGPFKPETLSCYASGQGKAEINVIGDNRAELRFESGFDQSRVRINCTMPAKDGDDDTPRWRWFGMLLTVPDKLLLN